MRVALGLACALATGCAATHVSGPCDAVPDFAGVPFRAVERGPFRFFVLPGTAADRELDDIAAVRTRALAQLSEALGVRDLERIDVFLSPNRRAAAAHGVGAGVTRFEPTRVEVLFPEGAGSFERHQYGHELVHAVARRLDPDHGHLPFISEGLAEVLDQSQRDLHLVWAQTLLAEGRTLDDALAFTDADTRGEDYPKAGSFMQVLRSLDARPETVRALFAATRSDEEATPDTLQRVLEERVAPLFGLSWASLKARWRQQVEARLAGPMAPVPERTWADAKALLATRDEALRRGDPELFRGTLEAFSCGPKDEPWWRSHAHRMTRTPRAVTTSIEQISPLDRKNFERVMVTAQVQEAGRRTTLRLVLEHFPEGWKVTTASDERAVTSGATDAR